MHDTDTRAKNNAGQVSWNQYFHEVFEPDVELFLAKIRAKISHEIKNSGSICISSKSGHVTLSGPVLESECLKLLECVQQIPGVISVEDRLELHKAEDKIPGLQNPRNQGVVDYEMPLKQVVLLPLAALALGFMAKGLIWKLQNQAR